MTGIPKSLYDKKYVLFDTLLPRFLTLIVLHGYGVFLQFLLVPPYRAREEAEPRAMWRSLFSERKRCLLLSLGPFLF